MSELPSDPLHHSWPHTLRTSDRMEDRMCAARAAAEELSIEPRIVRIDGVKGTREHDIPGPVPSLVADEERQGATSSRNSASRPAEGCHSVFAVGCGGLGPGGEGRAPRFCDLALADCHTDRLRSPRTCGCHQSDNQTYEKRAAAKVPMSAPIGALNARLRPTTAEPSAAISGHGSTTAGRIELGGSFKRERGPISVFLFFIDPPVHRWTAPRTPLYSHDPPPNLSPPSDPPSTTSPLVDGGLFRPQGRPPRLILV